MQKRSLKKGPEINKIGKELIKKKLIISKFIFIFTIVIYYI